MKFTLSTCPKAYLELKESPSNIFYIDFMFVPKNKRQQGFGTDLLEKCFRYLEAQKTKKVTIYFLSNDAINITFKIAKKFNIEVLPRFCVEKKNWEPFRFKTKEEILQSIKEFMIEFGYKSMNDIPPKTLLKNWGKVIK